MMSSTTSRGDWFVLLAICAIVLPCQDRSGEKLAIMIDSPPFRPPSDCSIRWRTLGPCSASSRAAYQQDHDKQQVNDNDGAEGAYRNRNDDPEQPEEDRPYFFVGLMNTAFLLQVYAGNCMHGRSGSKRMNNQVDDRADAHDHEEGACRAAPHSLALHSFGAKYTQH